jgi:hypothetical protein|nr:MAG TPA: Importin subunit alpha-2, Nuclear cap-binding repeat, Armadillo repeat, Nuclear.35A [Caudoviricetes sp.]
MNKKIVGGVIAGVGAVIGAGAMLFNKKRHGDDFDESDIARDEYGEIEDSEETEEK